MKKSLSLIAVTIIGLSLLVILTHYFSAMFQPVRWPTRIYFVLMFVVAAFCRPRLAIATFIFFLPLLPDLHIQLEGLLKPAVKYFVAHPALDAVAGLTLGLWTRRLFVSRRLTSLFEAPHWLFGLLLLMLSASTVTAVIRNIGDANLGIFDADFFLRQLIGFKLLNRGNDYLPIVDLITYAFAVLTISLLCTFFKSLPPEEREAAIIKPILFSVLISALWGIMQSITSYGLSQDTVNYRLSSLGWGAHGFQPDLHAFASVMLVGTVGLLGFMKKFKGRYVHLAYLTIGLCWFALILSKSKASLVLAVISSLVMLIFVSRQNGVQLKKIWYLLLGLVLSLAMLLLWSKNLTWVTTIGSFVLSPEVWDFEHFNRIFVHRPELFRAAWFIFVKYPLFGVGQGNFLSRSFDYELTQSTYLVAYQGDNAHNYFLQTLAETGLVGALTFAAVLSRPYFNTKQKNSLFPATIAIYSIFLGNLFSHSLLVRPNLIWLAVFIALLYSYMERCQGKVTLSSKGK